MKELLKSFTDFQTFVSKRGLELIEAIGTKWKLYETPEKFEVFEDGVNLTFQENTRHDCPDYENISLTIAELEMNADEWEQYLQTKREESARKVQEAIDVETKRNHEQKMKQFEKLKSELGM